MDYQSILNTTITEVKPSGIRKFFDIASEMDHVISLSVGEPDFSTPWHIRQEGIRTLEQGKTWYSPNAGLSALREAIGRYVCRHTTVDYNPKNEILVTVGGSEAIDLAFRALINAGDEVLIPEPSFVCYTPLAQLAGAKAVPLVTKAEDDFRLTAEAVRQALTERTKLLVLPFPNNPTGAVMSRSDLEQIAEVLRGTNVMILSDEIYGELTYGDEPHVSITSLPDMRERTVLISGFSKAFAMTGWRLGYACGPEPVIKQMLKLHQFGIMCAPTTAQYAAIEAMDNGEEDVEEMRAQYDMRRRFVVKELNDMGLSCFEPKGAFYVFPCIRSTGLSSEDFCKRLLEEQRVAVVPGSAFGESGEGYVRISYCYSVKHLTEALKRMRQFLQDHANEASV